MRNFLGLILGLVISGNALASSLTVRDIKLLGQGRIEIQLDGAPAKNALEIEFVRDIVQFSIQDATIYPAKILHSDEDSQAFSKVFAYQYAPNLVRVRFSVDGKADQFQGKVKWEQKGKLLTVSFPTGMVAKAAAKKETNDSHERSLLAKVLGNAKEDVKVEKIDDKEVKAEVSASSEAQPVMRSDKKKDVSAFEKSTQLGGARSGPSPIRSFLAMLFIVGGLGAILLYVKKKKGSAQAKKVGDSWISNLLSGSKKQKPLIEVIANHPLGPKQSITVVRIRGQQLVLGVTEGNVQLITQLDSDDDIDVMDDPKVADSLGKIFGGKPAVEKVAPAAKPAPVRAPLAQVPPREEANFGNLLKNSTGAGAIVARNAYQSQAVKAPQANQTNLQPSVRDQIKQRLQGMKS